MLLFVLNFHTEVMACLLVKTFTEITHIKKLNFEFQILSLQDYLLTVCGAGIYWINLTKFQLAIKFVKISRQLATTCKLQNTAV